MPTTLIYNVTELQAMSSDLAGTYALANAIDASATSGWNAGAGFAPVGTGTGVGRFTGSLDGQGHAITSLTVNRAASDYQGLFGSTVGATITNLSISGAVTGKDYVGPLVGRAYTSAISLCAASATVSGANSVGGLVGNSTTTNAITNCYATGNATASGTQYAGGLVGLHQSGCVIINCYATGAATAPSYAGGLVAYNVSATITNCYATGAATASTSFGGGLVGLGNTASAQLITGSWLTVAELKSLLWTLAAGWNFATIWQMTVVMPTITGMTIAAAQELLSAQGMTLNVTASVYHATVPAGQIITQSVVAGTGTAGLPTLIAHGVAASPKTGDVVDVVVSLGAQPTSAVPDVVGVSIADAVDAIEGENLTVDILGAYSETVPLAVIISQDPAAGTVVNEGTAVTITVSLGTGVETVAMPDVVGMEQFAAIAAIEGAGLTGTISEQYSEIVADDYVISQVPAAGVLIETGSGTCINVSKGTQYVVVPDVVGLDIAAADIQLGGLGLLSYYDGEFSSSIPLGQVYDQDPDAGDPILIGGEVTVYVSKGVEQSTMPDVIGERSARAVTAITSVGLVANITTAYHASIAEGIVISQIPDAGTIVETGGDVGIVVSLGPSFITVPDVTGEYYLTAKWATEYTGLVYASTLASSASVHVGYTISQSPVAGAHVAAGSTVNVVVSTGTATDVVNQIATYLDAVITTATTWRTTLPPGFGNTTPTLVVNVQATRSHNTNATRGVEFTIRVYGGSNKINVAAALAETVIDAINAASSRSVYGFMRFGDLSWQELPPEPITGWPSCLISGRVRTT
jgi:beta-lactam-binding protein with PASTA domain